MLPTPGWMRLPLNRDGGCHPHMHETYELDGSPPFCQTGRDCDSCMRVIALVRLYQGAGGRNAPFDPIQTSLN